MRTLIAFWAAALAAPVLLAGTITLKASSADAQPGGKAAVTIDMAGEQGIGAMHVELTYDASVLAAEAVEAGAALQGATMQSNHATPGRVILAIATDKSVRGGGPLATVRFKVVGAGGQESALALEKCKAWSDDEAEMPVPIETANGRLRVLRPEVAQGVPTGGKAIPWLPIGVGAGVLAVLLLIMGTRGRQAPASATCPHCGAAASADAQFCPKCGKPRATVATCSKCGGPFQGDARFCAKCGTPRS